MWAWVAFVAVGIALEINGMLTSDPTLSETIQAAWRVDWAKPVLAVAWAILTGHFFLGWWK